MIPYGLKFNAAQSLCGNLLFILPSIEIRNNRMFLDFDALMVVNCRDYSQLYINDINLDVDCAQFLRDDYLFTPEKVGQRLSAPITYCRIDPNWKAPNFEMVRQQGGMNVK
jgi:hypothetical protein